MINKNFLQATTIASVVQAGVASDGHFYTQCRINNPASTGDNDKFINAFVRTHTEEERTAFYQETRGLSYEEAERDSFIVSSRQRKTLDVAGQFAAKIEDAKSHGHFKGVSDKDIMENRLGGMMVALHGVAITHKIKDSTAPFDSSNPNQSYFVATADKIVVTGMLKDSAYLEELGNDSAHTKAQASNTMARFILNPPENGKPALAEAYEVADANNINFKQLVRNPTVMDSMIESNSRPFHEKSETYHRDGFLEMNVSYDKKLHRFSFDSGTLDSGEHKFLDEKGLADVASAWKDEYEHNVGRFRAMQDPDTLDSVNPDHLAKLDLMRVILLASQEPRKFQGFMDKVNNQDPTAFHGVTKIDFMNDQNLSADQGVVRDIVKALAKDPESVFINAVAHNKMNISANLEEAMTESMAASYAKANKGRQDTKNNLFGKSSTAQSRITNSGLDVVKTNQFGDVLTTVIPIVKVTEVHPKGQYTAVKDQVHAVHKVVAQDKYTISEGGKARWQSNNITYTDDKFAPVNLVKAANRPIDFGQAQNLRLLDGAKKPVDSRDRPAKPAPNDFTNSLEEYVSYDVGRVDLNANLAPNKITIASPAQASFAYPKLAFKHKFVELMEQNQEHALPAIKRFDEMTEVVSQIMGGFSKDNPSINVYRAVLTEDPSKLDEKHNKVRDMLLGDQLVAVDITDKRTGETTTKNYNFSDVVAVTLNSKKPLRRAITDDVADKLADLNQDGMDRFKAERVDQSADMIIKRLKESTMTADDFCQEIENLSNDPTPTPNQSLRV